MSYSGYWLHSSSSILPVAKSSYLIAALNKVPSSIDRAGGDVRGLALRYISAKVGIVGRYRR